MMKRVRPTEKDMRGVAWRDLERDASMRCASGEERVLERLEDGPGMAEEEGVLRKERAHARPPGWRRRKHMKRRNMARMVVNGEEKGRKGRKMSESKSCSCAMATQREMRSRYVGMKGTVKWCLNSKKSGGLEGQGLPVQIKYNLGSKLLINEPKLT